MSQRVYLHVGVPKSGTTFLQVSLAENKKSLKEAGVLYPAGHERMFLAAVDVRGAHKGWGRTRATRAVHRDEREPDAERLDEHHREAFGARGHGVRRSPGQHTPEVVGVPRQPDLVPEPQPSDLVGQHTPLGALAVDVQLPVPVDAVPARRPAARAARSGSRRPGSSARAARAGSPRRRRG